MTDAVILAIVTGAPATIAAIVSGLGVLVSLRNSKKADVLKEASDEIHVAVNSNLQEMKVALAKANESLVGVTRSNEELKAQILSGEKNVATLAKIIESIKVNGSHTPPAAASS